jgi:hypothetical protein
MNPDGFVQQEAAPPGEPTAAPPAEPVGITVARTLVKSEPELAELVASEERLKADGLGVRLAEKGFGTRVEITASPESGIAESYLETLLDELAEPQKRPFTAS